ncbi:hypothetical protein BKA67DRAFT_573188 [Truncatella angustata]|uniref:F-box domain-containing protein n=1 Tax=Truncatella angustata TaxID=152316 RepID=A0A9P8ZVQ5_9PEZI|nr:uncharacterized protein BKA67DRAFT_573188 [Truncatella angustata]KAH6652171.1 hypothetical protein BKA67DRAFT_573188 [Truncatella angustata]
MTTHTLRTWTHDLAFKSPHYFYHSGTPAMVCTWLLRWALGRTAPNQARSTVSVSSNHDSPTAISTTPEAEESQEVQEIQETQAPSLGLLPTELILLIAELFTAADAICLALTCKRMYYILHVQDLARRLDANATEILLCRIEKDIVGVSYCVVGQKLAQFTTYTLLRQHLHFHRHMTTKSNGPLHINFGLSRFYFHWCTARLATNYQILGPQHGLPASLLTFTYDHQDKEHGVCWKEVWAAKVVHGELFISCIHTVFHGSADAGTLQTYLNTKGIAICRHLEVGGGRGYRVRVGLPTNLINNTGHYDIGWCRRCETDWETSVESTERGWTVTAKTYHGLGTCRSPHDPKWHAMASRYKPPFREVPRGAVKASWEKV